MYIYITYICEFRMQARVNLDSKCHVTRKQFAYVTCTSEKTITINSTPIPCIDCLRYSSVIKSDIPASLHKRAFDILLSYLAHNQFMVNLREKRLKHPFKVFPIYKTPFTQHFSFCSLRNIYFNNIFSPFLCRMEIF